MKRSELIEKLLAIGDPTEDYDVVMDVRMEDGETSSYDIDDVGEGWLPSGVIDIQGATVIRS